MRWLLALPLTLTLACGDGDTDATGSSTALPGSSTGDPTGPSTDADSLQKMAADHPIVLIAEELSPATVDALGGDFDIRVIDVPSTPDAIPWRWRGAAPMSAWCDALELGIDLLADTPASETWQLVQARGRAEGHERNDADGWENDAPAHDPAAVGGCVLRHLRGQQVACGSEFTASGLSFSAAFTSTTSPEPS